MFKNVTHDIITAGTTTGVAELSRMTEKEVVGYNDAFNSGITNTSNCFFFNRLKVKVEGKGEGAKIMAEVATILKLLDLSVILVVNPYGNMGLDCLIGFYKKYNFKLIEKFNREALMTYGN